MATQVARGDSQSVAVIGRARTTNRVKRWWKFVNELPVLPIMLLLILLTLALMAGTPWWGGITGMNPEAPSLRDRNAPIGS